MDIIVNQPKRGVDAGKIPTPEMPVEPPKEVKEMTFNVDSMPGAKPDNTVITSGGKEVQQVQPEKKEESVLEPPKKEEVKKEEPQKKETVVEKKEEPKKEEPKKEEVSKLSPVLEAPAGTKGPEPTGKEKITPITPVKDDFDFTKYSPQEQIVLKNMSHQSRAHVVSLIEENKRLKTTVDSSYLQHELGYTLSPDFRNLQVQEFLARDEGQAWEKALLAIKSGQKFQDIVGRDPKTGQLQFVERDPSDVDEIRITQNLQACSSALNQVQANLNQYPTRYRNQLQADLQAIEQTSKERFAWVADPSLLEYSVNIEGKGKTKLKDIKADFKAMIPSYMLSHPMTEVAANIFTAMIVQGVELRRAQSGQQVAETKVKEASLGEPSSDATLQAPMKSKVNGQEVPSLFSLEGMPTR